MGSGNDKIYVRTMNIIKCPNSPKPLAGAVVCGAISRVGVSLRGSFKRADLWDYKKEPTDDENVDSSSFSGHLYS